VDGLLFFKLGSDASSGAFAAALRMNGIISELLVVSSNLQSFF
jgi:hypothetical protein